jgi:hypothetical protein
MTAKTNGVTSLREMIAPCALSPTALRSTIVAFPAPAADKKLSARSVPCHVVSLAVAAQLIVCWTSPNGPAGCRSIPYVESAPGSGA